MKPRDFLENKEFIQVIQQSLAQTIALLFKNSAQFKIVTDISRVSFNPELPSDLTKNFQALTVFALENYTFTSAKLMDDCLTFEAGFGSDDYASFVSVPLSAILQISIENTPIFLNLSIDTVKPQQTKEDKSKESLEALLKNPENKKLIKK
ncbi:MAG: hypothetical protein LBT96_04555 [Campylobacteraceae bacterium]|jgi:hypothetical protein|nr:hypothetical protein [Campylobacteraceae bacterium]